MDRIPKKLRLFLDGTQKYKHRLGALLAFLESSTEAEQQRVYKDLPDQLVTFVVESHNLTLERLNVDREFHGKFERALARSDLDEHFKVPMLLEKVLRYLRAELSTMAQSDQLANIVRTLLHPGNHPTLRREGMRLLLLWLRDESSVLPETLALFASCVPLKLWVTDGAIINQLSFPLAPENEPPFFPTPSGFSAREQALALLNVMLEFITFDVDADRQSTWLLYRLFREHYLCKLYPVVSHRLGLVEKLDASSAFLMGCPADIQAVVMRYFAMWTVQSPELFAERVQMGGASIPVATFILQEMLLASEPDLELIYEVISQSLQLPFAHRTIIKMAVQVLRTWVFNSRERRPIFLQGVATHKPTVALCEREGLALEDVLDNYLQRYMGLISQLFDGRSATAHALEQMELYREGIYFFRGLAMQAFFVLGRSSWDCLLSTLLRLMESHLAEPSNKYAIISSPDAAEEFAQLLTETLLGAWIRSETVEKKHWEGLSVVLASCTRWGFVVDEWARTVMALTNVMSECVFSAAASLASVAEDAPNLKRKMMRGGVFESSRLAALVSQTSPIGRAMAAELLNPTTTAEKLVISTSLTTQQKDNFLSWTELPWARENVVFLWRNMLRSLGDINEIERPDIHEMAILCLVKIFERLLAIRDAQPYFFRPLPPLYEDALVTTLMDACDLPARAYERSRCLAYSAVCRMFCRRHDMSFPDEYYTRFYLALVNGLSDKDDPVASVILLAASHLFSRQLPGATILIPAFLKCIAGMLNSQVAFDKSGILVPMMRLAATVAILPDVYAKLSVPRIEAPLPIMSAIPITCAGEMELDGIKMQVKDLLFMMDLQEFVRVDAPTHSNLLSTASLLLLNELLAQENPSQTLIDGYLNVLLDHLLPKDAGVLPVVFDQFYAMAQLLPLGNDRLGPERQTLIIQRLVTGIRSAFADIDAPPVAQDELTAKLILTLLEWLTVLPTDWLGKHHSLREQIFAVLEESLRRGVAVATVGKSHSQGALTGSPRKSLDRLPPLPKDDMALGQPSSDMEEDFGLAREAAEFALIHLTHHLRNFAPEYGATMLSSQVSEPAWHGAQEDRVLYFAFNDTAIIALQQLPGGKSGSGKPQVRFTVRNAAGRFTWDSHVFFETFLHRDSSLFPTGEAEKWGHVGHARDLSLSSVTAVENVEPYISAGMAQVTLDSDETPVKSLPVFDGGVNLEQTDILKVLLSYIGTEHPECVDMSNRLSLVVPEPVAESRRAMVTQISELCANQITAEKVVAETYASSKSQHERIEPIKAKGSHLITPPYQYCRQFLAAFGFLAPGEGTELSVHVLAKTTGMGRDIRGLDTKHSREVIKMAVLYVAPGQEDELSILRNGPDEVSAAYDEFLKGLGWRVLLEDHPGYCGGLEPGMTINDDALYFCTSTTEVVFHEAPRLCLQGEADEKLISKKRHIGNDHVHIIWNEHYRDYRSATRGDYANVQIVISPAPSCHLYRVSIFREASIPSFGPLFDGALIPRALLGPLVRTTAICAHRAVLSALGRSNTRHPMSHRARDLSLIVKRHAQARWSLDQFLQYVIFANSPLPEELPKEQVVKTAITEGIERLAIDSPTAAIIDSMTALTVEKVE